MMRSLRLNLDSAASMAATSFCENALTRVCILLYGLQPCAHLPLVKHKNVALKACCLLMQSHICHN